MESTQTNSGVSTGYLPIPTAADHDTTVTIVGKTRTFAGLEAIEWAFITLSFANVLSCVGLTIANLVLIITDDPSEPAFTYPILILINTGFCLLYVIHGILREKEFEIYAYMAGAACVLAYCILEYSLNKDQRNHIKLSRLIVGSCLVPFNVLLGVLVARRFGWLEFKIVGASEVMQYMYREASRFGSLLKFDLQSVLTCLVLDLRRNTSITILLIIVGVVIIFSLLWCLLGWLSVRKEWKIGAVIFGFLGLVAPALCILGIYEIYLKMSHDEPQTEIMMLDYVTLAAGAVFLTVRAILFFELYSVYRNFNQGLKERAFDVDERTSLLSIASKR